jgi:C-terminal processing protease CtpA/Prc
MSKRLALGLAVTVLLTTNADAQMNRGPQQSESRGGPSFSCGGSLAPAEAVICADETLASLDRRLASLYVDRLDALRPDAQADFRVSQRTWLAERNRCRTDKACLLNSYHDRLSSLEEPSSAAPPSIAPSSETSHQNQPQPPASTQSQQKVSSGPEAASASSGEAPPAGGPGWLGVTLDSATSGSGERLGALVKDLDLAGPAASAGVKVGDVITAVNDQAIKSATELAQAVKSRPPGTTVSLAMLRDGSLKTLSVKLARLPEAPAAEAPTDRGGPQASQGSSVGEPCGFPFAGLDRPENHSAFENIAAKVSSQVLQRDQKSLDLPNEANGFDIFGGKIGKVDLSDTDAVIFEFLNAVSTNLPPGPAKLSANSLSHEFINSTPPFGWIGVQVKNNDQPPPMSPVVVNDPDPTGPAGNAGIKSGDLLIAVNNRPVQSIDALFRTISSITPGSVVEVRVGHRTQNGNYPQQQLQVTVGTMDARQKITRQVLACFPFMQKVAEDVVAQRNGAAEAERRKQEQFDNMLGEMRQQAEAARQREAQLRQQQEQESRKPENLLRASYSRYIFIKQCWESRSGYLAVFISDPEMERAKKAVSRIEDKLKPQLPSAVTTDELWSEANNGTNRLPVTQEFCQHELDDLETAYRNLAPEDRGVRKDF